jgi:hypothetical protein
MISRLSECRIMRLHSFKLALITFLLSGCLIGVGGHGVFAHTSSKRFDSSLGPLWRTQSERAEPLDQTPGGGQEQSQRKSPAGKRRPLHDYGPDDVLPERQENENPRRRKGQAGQLKAGNRTPVTSAPVITPVPEPTPTVTPASAVISTAPAVTSTIEATSLPRQVRKRGVRWWVSLVGTSLLFLLALFALFFVATKLRQQVREGREAPADQASREVDHDAEMRQTPSDGRAGTVERSELYGRASGNLKNKMRKAHNT